MDDAFQQLSYSEISAQNINKNPQQGIIDTKSRGGFVRLVIFVGIGCLILACGISLIVQNNKLTKMREDIKALEAEQLKQSQHLDNFTRKYSELKTKKIQYEKSIDSLNLEVKSLKTENSTWSEKNKTVTESLDKVVAQYANLSEQFQKDYSYNIELAANISRLELQNRYLIQKIDELTE